MSFIPFVAETAGAVGSVVGTETGSALLAGVASSAVVKGAESITSNIVDSIFGPNTFENLETSINELYGKTQKLGSDINKIKTSVETGERITGQDISTLKTSKEEFSNTAIVIGLSQFAKDFSHLVSQSDHDPLNQNTSFITNILNNLSKINPLYAYLSSKFLNGVSDFVIPTNEEYLKVSRIYNGQGLYDQNMTTEKIGSNFDFSLIDETGTKIIWKYPFDNSSVVIPALYGVYVGLNSPNNSSVLSGTIDGKFVESFLDKIAFFHDVSYLPKEKGGYGAFNATGDYALISRIEYGRQNNLFIFPGELEYANIALSYFSTLGAVMRKLFGDPNITPKLGSTASISGIVKQPSKEPLIKEIISEVYNVQVENTIDIANKVVQETRNIPTSYGSSEIGSSNFALRNLLNNLEIELS